MKKLTTFTATLLVGFGLVSCKGDDTTEKGADDKQKDATAQTDAPAGDNAKMETVSINVTGMT